MERGSSGGNPAPAASIGENIRTRRRRLGMTQEELARRLGVTQAHVSRMEASPRGPSTSLLLPVAEALACDVRDLLGAERTETGAKAETETETEPRLDGDARAFVLRALESDPQLKLYLRSFVQDQDSYTEEDWKFLAASFRLALGYAADTIRARRIRGSF